MTQTLSLRDARRKRKRMTQARLASVAEVDQTYVSLLERGLRFPSDEIKDRLAKALGIAPSRLRFDNPRPSATVSGGRDRQGHDSISEAV